MISQIVLLRHATRSAVLDFATGGESPLNAVGLAQAQDLVDLVARKTTLPSPTRLVASPKLRARQTLEPLSQALKIALEIDENLDERRDNESSKTFEDRIRKLSDKYVHNSGATIFLCTHLDVLEAAALSWPTTFSERESSMPWSTLEYQVFKVNNGLLESGARGRIEPYRS